MSITEFNPDKWLETLQRALADFTRERIDAFVKNDADVDSGLLLYDIVFDWPQADDIGKTILLKKSVIHFLIDDIQNVKLGFGDDVVAGTETIPPSPQTVAPEQARCHIVNFDVGVWASDKTGGSTARLVIYQMLDRIFGGEVARKDLNTATQGIEIIRFNGGGFVTDRINDIRVFRIIDCELVVRVYSRVKLEDEVITEDVVQEPHLQIDNLPVS